MANLLLFPSVRAILVCAFICLPLFFAAECGDEPSKQTFIELPRARNGYTTSPRVVFVSYDDQSAIYKIGEKEITDPVKVAEGIAVKAKELGSDYPLIYFCFPENFPGSTFASLCQQTQRLTENRSRFGIMVFPPSESGEEPKSIEKASVLFFGRVVPGSDDPQLPQKLDELSLIIRKDGFEWGEERTQDISTLRDRFRDLTMAAQAIDFEILINVKIEEGVDLQRFVSVFDYFEGDGFFIHFVVD